MFISSPTSQAEAAPAVPATQQPTTNSKPASATCCYALALLTAIAATVLIVLQLMSGAGFTVIAATAGGFPVAVLWWALGDIVAGISDLSR